ncbi:MAG TPA: arylesterase [Chitinophagaceae bacterium]|nr:arylesterase [Chitinophagaceae bacterium]
MKKVCTASLILLAFFIFSCNNNKPTSSESNEKKDTAAAGKIKTIIFFGNSLTAGYGIEPSQAFPALIQKKIDSLDLPYKVINAGVSGETTSGGNSRIDWILRQPVDVFVLELGANDGLRGIPIGETKSNLQSIIRKVWALYPDAKIILAGMQIPPNMGQQYASAFREIFPELARKNNVALVPFILEGVGGEEKLNQEDGIHPTEEGHKIVAENIWRIMKDIL